MHIHILGICGTFMGGIAVLARELGHKVTGSDANVYPPMSTMLESQGIEIIQGFDDSQLKPHPDLVIVGNAMSRGQPLCRIRTESQSALYLWAAVVTRGVAVRSLGARRGGDPWQNHNVEHACVDFRAQWLPARFSGWRGIRKLWHFGALGQ